MLTLQGMGFQVFAVLVLALCCLPSCDAFGDKILSKKEIEEDRKISKALRIAAFMPGKAFVIKRYDKSCKYAKRNYYLWFTFPEDDVVVAVCFGTGNGNCTNIQLKRESTLGYYEISDSSLNQIKKTDSAFECLIRILLKEPISSYYTSTANNQNCHTFSLKLQRIIEVYKLLDHASLYKEKNALGALFYLTDPGFVVNYCKQNGYM